MKLKVVAVVALAAVGVGAVVFAFGGIGAKAASTTQYLTAAATRGDVTDDVAATGTTLESCAAALRAAGAADAAGYVFARA